jgi:lysozyme
MTRITLLVVVALLSSGFFFPVRVAATELDRVKLKNQLTRHEGKKNKVYKDSLGILTIGVGFNLERSDAKKRIAALGLDIQKVKDGTQELSDDQILKLLDGDINIAIDNCKSVFPKFSDLSDVRQRVLADMMFNLGKSRFEGFKKMIANIQAGDFGKAADEMKSSKWHQQVGDRGKRLEAMMRTDKDAN